MMPNVLCNLISDVNKNLNKILQCCKNRTEIYIGDTIEYVDKSYQVINDNSKMYKSMAKNI